MKLHNVALSLAALLLASAANGDGVCNKGYRDTTEAERATMTHALEAIKGALPAAPQGWVIGGYEEISVMTTLCGDMELDPWPYQFSRQYSRVDNQDARDRLMNEVGAIMQADMTAKQPRLDAINAQVEALTPDLVTAAQKGDLAAADTINQKIAGLQEQFKRIADEGDAQARANVLILQASQDIEMLIVTSINPRAEWTSDDTQPVPPPPGAQSAVRWTTTRNDGLVDGHALILLGQWQAKPDGTFTPVARANVSPPAPHAIAVKIQADKDRLGSMIGAVDYHALAALLAK